jgi:AcrR family transcriptional regulator
VSPTPSERRAETGRYHHGDLRAALVDAAVELIGERGVRGFSLAEVSRRLGVSAGAPYKHFPDRETLLAAVAARAFEIFGEMLGIGADTVDEDADGDLTPADRLAAMVGAYVRFAAERRPLFDTLFSAGIDKSRFPEVHRAEAPIDAALERSVRALCADDPVGAEALEGALIATAHGYATLLLDGEYGTGPDVVAVAAQRASNAALAVIEGRAALRGPTRRETPRWLCARQDGAI